MIKAKHIKGVNSNGYVLTTNASGVVSWQPASGGGAGGFTFSSIDQTYSGTPAASYHYSVSLSSALTINLPTSSLSSGDEIRFKLTTSGHNLTLNPGDWTIDGSTTDYVISNINASVTLITDGSSKWEIV